MDINKKPIAISTWKHGLNATKKAIELLNNKNSSLDAVEQAVKITESDPLVRTVGYGGYTDNEGCVTLDASIMDHKGNAGSVAYVKNFKHPISIARKVMEKTNHVMLVGDGAEKFALDNGFKQENIISEKSKKEWQEWKKKNKKIKIDANNHDTITTLAQDVDGNLAAASTTSGLAYKLNGRVGDSPIIGSGIYLDNDVGCAGATGHGEEIMKAVGSFLIVELMKQGYTAQKACDEAIKRIVNKKNQDLQVAYIALRKDGKIGASSIQKNFFYVSGYKKTISVVQVKGILE